MLEKPAIASNLPACPALALDMIDIESLLRIVGGVGDCLVTNAFGSHVNVSARQELATPLAPGASTRVPSGPFAVDAGNAVVYASCNGENQVVQPMSWDRALPNAVVR